MVASVKFPYEFDNLSVLPCSENEALTVCISRSVYSPRPLKVYLFPSRVVMWGSPKNIAADIECGKILFIINGPDAEFLNENHISL